MKNKFSFAFFQQLLSSQAQKKSERVILTIAIASFLVHLAVIFLVDFGVIHLENQLPLLFAFGLYFIGQHSITSWQHISTHLKLKHQKIWLQALPFHAGAWLILLLFLYFYPSNDSFTSTDKRQWGIFFIFIACISLPHVISMQSVYSKKK
jgi:hypothetical protein